MDGTYCRCICGACVDALNGDTCIRPCAEQHAQDARIGHDDLALEEGDLCGVYCATWHWDVVRPLVCLQRVVSSLMGPLGANLPPAAKSENIRM